MSASADRVGRIIAENEMAALAPEERAAAKKLAVFRQDLAWRYADRPAWKELSPAEQASMTVEALHWLRAARDAGMLR